MDSWKLLVRRTRQLWRLDWHSQGLLLQALVLFPVVAISLEFWGLKRTQAALGRVLLASTTQVGDGEVSPKMAATIRMVQVAARCYQPWANCLKKSLVLWGLLGRQGINSELRIGVRREEGNFQAHAWVESGGVVLNDTADVRSRFAMFDSSLEIQG